MRKVRLLSILLGMVAVAAPAHASWANDAPRFDAVQLGMTPEQVEVHVGPAHALFWDYGEKRYLLGFVGDELDSMLGPPLQPGSPPVVWPVQLGMTRAQVEAVMGPPDRVCRRYGAGTVMADVCFKDDKLVSKQMADWPATR